MLVHDSRKNETRVIDFRETAPSALHQDLLYTNLDVNVRQKLRHHILMTVRLGVTMQEVQEGFYFL